jgi:hypothetical protein
MKCSNKKVFSIFWSQIIQNFVFWNISFKRKFNLEVSKSYSFFHFRNKLELDINEDAKHFHLLGNLEFHTQTVLILFGKQLFPKRTELLIYSLLGNLYGRKWVNRETQVSQNFKTFRLSSPKSGLQHTQKSEIHLSSTFGKHMFPMTRTLHFCMRKSIILTNSHRHLS